MKVFVAGAILMAVSIIFVSVNQAFQTFLGAPILPKMIWAGLLTGWAGIGVAMMGVCRMCKYQNILWPGMGGV